MLTRLKVSGFKNLVDVDVRFGAFTCIAGANGVGKSNLFDAIRLLSALADRPLMEAARSVRDDKGKTTNVSSLFHQHGSEHLKKMSFEAEMIIPAEGEDDLGQKAEASSTFLVYRLVLSLQEQTGTVLSESIKIDKEELVYITKSDSQKHLSFDHSKDWLESAIKTTRRKGPFISTKGLGKDREIQLHQDGGKRGKPFKVRADDLPRTLLSNTNAVESPTALLARQEMMSWRLMQLEPASLRKPDEFSAPTNLGADGSHLAATLSRLVLDENQNGLESHLEESRVCSQIAGRVAELLPGEVRRIWVDKDERRQLLTLYVEDREGTVHEARALSDGTLRFLALSMIEQDSENLGVMCLEEPENGIHPERIPAMIQLLRDIAVDPNEPFDSDNPLRQVIVNTHSPAVVAQVNDDDLLVAETRESVHSGKRLKGVRFSCLPETWRTEKSQDKEEAPICQRGELLSYLNPVEPRRVIENESVPSNSRNGRSKKKPRRVVDREDFTPFIWVEPYSKR